jgi:hypothetical protein
LKIFLFITFLFSIIFNVYAQDDNNGIEFHSASFSPLSVYFSNRDGGVGFNFDVALNKGKQIFNVYVGGAVVASDIVLGDNKNDQLLGFNLM